MRHQPPVVQQRLCNQSLVVVQNTPQPCPYLTDRQARMPLQWPTRNIDGADFDQFMEIGYRRSGPFVYHTLCDDCRACESTRVDVRRFRWTKSFRRVLKRGDHSLTMIDAEPRIDRAKLALLNKHRMTRDLGFGTELSEDDYRSFLIETCCQTREFNFFYQDQLAAVATVDIGEDSISAVYCYFDPALSRLSLGTYAILKQLEFAHETSRSFLYLGMYVASNRHLNYKARFQPQQRRVADQWIWFDGEN